MRDGSQQRLAASDQKPGLPRRADEVPAAFGAEMASAGLVGRMSPVAALSLQRAIGNDAFARLVGQERHQHSAGCGHGGAVQRIADDQAVQRDALAEVDAVTRSSGSPIRADVQRMMESDYGG